MKFWIGQRGWGWRLFGISYGSKWFIGVSIANRDGLGGVE